MAQIRYTFCHCHAYTEHLLVQLVAANEELSTTFSSSFSTFLGFSHLSRFTIAAAASLRSRAHSYTCSHLSLSSHGIRYCCWMCLTPTKCSLAQIGGGGSAKTTFSSVLLLLTASHSRCASEETDRWPRRWTKIYWLENVPIAFDGTTAKL